MPKSPKLLLPAISAVALAVLILAALTWSQGVGYSLVCVDAREIGIEGEPPFWGAAVWENGRLRPAMLYVEEETIRSVGIWEMNSTSPRVAEVTVLPARLRGKIRFEVGEPVYRPEAARARGKYVEVDTERGRRAVYLIRIDEDPLWQEYALPAVPIYGEIPAKKVKMVRAVDLPGRGPAALPQSVSDPVSGFTNFQSIIVAVFKLRQTDNYQLMPGYTAVGQFPAPPGVTSATLVFTPAFYSAGGSMFITIKVEIYDESGALIKAYTIPSNGYIQVPPNSKP